MSRPGPRRKFEIRRPKLEGNPNWEPGRAATAAVTQTFSLPRVQTEPPHANVREAADSKVGGTADWKVCVTSVGRESAGPSPTAGRLSNFVLRISFAFRPSSFGFKARRTPRALALRAAWNEINRQICHSTSPTVARMTSSGVVKPANTLRIPSSRKVRMPISRARLRRTEEETFS